MNYDDENWIKVYTRDTAGWLSVSWQARGLALEIGRKLPKSTGELSLGRRGLEALASLLRADWSEIAPFIQELIDDGRLAYDERSQTISDPQHVARQNAIASTAERKRRERERKAALQSPDVTTSHATSRQVTPSHRESPKEREEEKEKKEKSIGSTAAPDPAPQSVTAIRVHRKPETPCPPSGASAGEIRDWSERWGIPDGHAEFVGFLDHHRKSDARWRDWGAAWRNWLKNAAKFSKPLFNRPGAIVQPGDNRAWKVPEGLE